MRDAILAALHEKGELPPLPDILLQLQRMVSDPSANARDIARLIELEPVLAGRIIKLSNSVHYARSPEAIKTLPVAITKIGLTMLMNLVYSLKLGTLFDGNRVLDGPLFWRHSIAVAFLSRSLCRRQRGSQLQQDMVYLAGLMHDVGIMVFGYLVPDEYRRFISHIHETGVPIEELEREAFGIDHAELGALFTDIWWNIDPAVSGAILSHHRNTCGEEAKGTASAGPRMMETVYIANRLCNASDISNGIECPHEEFDPAVSDCRELAGYDLDTLIDDIRVSIAQAEELVALKYS